MSNTLRVDPEYGAALLKRAEGFKRDREHPPTSAPAKPHTLSLPAPLERDVQAEVLDAIEMCPCVAWAHRMNTGGMHAEYQGKDDPAPRERYIAFAFDGCSDILGQMRDGRFLAVEVKRRNKNPTKDQQDFLTLVAANGGIAFVARCAEDVFNHLRRDLQGKVRT